MDALGLTMSDLYPDVTAQAAFSARAGSDGFTAVYEYPGGVQKCRKPDKSFIWRRPDGRGGWVWNRKDVPHSLYIRGNLSGLVCVAEGEKDADNLHALGFSAASGADGAGPGKWRTEYTMQLAGCDVVIFQDHDKVGRAYAAETAAALHGVATRVRVLDLSMVWPEIPEHGDVSDMIETFGAARATDLIKDLIERAQEWQPEQDDPFLSCFKTLGEFEEQEARWLVPGWLPEGQITLLAADGGIGKTSLWINLIAAISSGQRCILDPPGHTRAAQCVAFITTEDSVRKTLKKKLREAGANEKNIISPDFAQDKDGALKDFKLGSSDLDRFIRFFRPSLCVIDPIQGMLPRGANMAARNEMREALAPLLVLGEETGCSFLIVAHSNKRKAAAGRDRIADSADLWDLARSVVLAGYTDEQGIRYLSQEKSNYGPLQETVLFSVDGGGQIRPEGTTWKKDRDFVLEAGASVSGSRKGDCRDWYLHELEAAGGVLPVKDLESKAELAGYSARTLRRVKEDLKQSGDIKIVPVGSAKGGNRVFYVHRIRLHIVEDDSSVPWSS